MLNPEVLATEVFPRFEFQTLCLMGAVNKECNELLEEARRRLIQKEYSGALTVSVETSYRLYYRDLKTAQYVRCYEGSVVKRIIQVNPYSIHETLLRIPPAPSDKIICLLDAWLWCVTDPQKVHRIVYYPKHQAISFELLINELVSGNETNFFGICQNNQLLFGWNRYNTLAPLKNHSIVTIGHAIRLLKVDLSEIPRGNINEVYQQHILEFSNEVDVSEETIQMLLDVAKIPLPLISIAIEHRLRKLDQLLVDF